MNLRPVHTRSREKMPKDGGDAVVVCLAIIGADRTSPVPNREEERKTEQNREPTNTAQRKHERKRE